MKSQSDTPRPARIMECPSGGELHLEHSEICKKHNCEPVGEYRALAESRPSADAPPHHCCLRCGWTPIEGMEGYLRIHGDEAQCLRCNDKLFGQIDPYPEAEGAAVQPPAPTTCSHPAELKVRTIETNTEICEFCETRDERRDALEMEAHYKAISRVQAAEITRLREALDKFEQK